MVKIKEKKIKEQLYYYLEHSIRHGEKIEKKETYLGTSIPENIEELKKKFLSEIFSEKWFGQLDKIKKNYLSEQKSLPKSIREKEIKNFMIKFTYDTNRIEGSKLSLRETADLLERGITPNKKPLRDIKEAESHKEVFYEMLNYRQDLSLKIILLWHMKLFKQTNTNIAGVFRNYQVGISGSKFLPPPSIDVQPLMKEFNKWYQKNKNKLHAVEVAALVHLKFVTIHPFGDGNGRMGRLLMNFILQRNRFPMFDIPYEKRGSYYTALERSQTKEDDAIFLSWFFRRYIKENKRYMKK
jgi:Fic family protein